VPEEAKNCTKFNQKKKEKENLKNLDDDFVPEALILP
jgi:hypothetical protein